MRTIAVSINCVSVTLVQVVNRLLNLKAIVVQLLFICAQLERIEQTTNCLILFFFLFQRRLSGFHY
jgi:hypothetical protein